MFGYAEAAVEAALAAGARGALAPGRVTGVGSDARLVSAYYGVHHVPTLRLASWNFTGNARG